jgi:hypothetical protein
MKYGDQTRFVEAAFTAALVFHAYMTDLEN